MTKVGKWAIMGLPQPNKSDEGRYAAGEKAAPAFLCQSSVRSRQRPQRQAQRRKGEEGVFGRRAACRPLRSIGGWDRERAALGRMSGLWGTTRTLRRGLRSARRVTPFAPAKEAAPAFGSQSSVLSRQRSRHARRKDDQSEPVCACKLKAKGIYLVAASGATFFVEDTRPPSSSGKCSLPAPAARMMMGALRR
jgi:hypothetical protein